MCSFYYFRFGRNNARLLKRIIVLGILNVAAFNYVKSKCKSIQCNLKKNYSFLLIISFCLILSDNCASRKKKAQLWLIFICWIFYIRFVDISSLLIVPSHSKYYVTYNSSKQHQLSWSSPLDVFKQINRKKVKCWNKKLNLNQNN